MQTTIERPMFRLRGLFRDVDSLPVQICLKRTMNIREPRFDEGGAQNAIFFVEFSLQRELANRLRPQTCIQRTTNTRQRQLLEFFFSPTLKRAREDTSMSSSKANFAC
jgi:hypothetical protein